MNKEVKKDWIAALKSGKYSQNQGTLRSHQDNNAYCCLGVLCDLYHNQTGLGRWQDDLNMLRWQFYDGSVEEIIDYSSGVLTNDVRRWAELADLNPILQYNGKATSLAQLNDAGKTFEDIAKIIEERF